MDDDARTDHPAAEPQVQEPADASPRSAWDRAFDGPPINPRSELIYHDGRSLRSRHA